MTLNNNHRAEQPASDVACANQQASGGALPPAAERIPVDTPTGAGPPSPDPSNVARAERMADDLTAKCAAVTSACVRRLARLTAHAREAAQDFWAEVQSVRRKDQG